MKQLPLKLGNKLIDRKETNSFPKLASIRANLVDFSLNDYSRFSKATIHSCIILGNERIRKASENLKAQGFDIKSIFSPTAPKGKEGMRICLHSFNTIAEIPRGMKYLATLIHNH